VLTAPVAHGANGMLLGVSEDMVLPGVRPRRDVKRGLVDCTAFGGIG
jgi:hypothetical protein